MHGRQPILARGGGLPGRKFSAMLKKQLPKATLSNLTEDQQVCLKACMSALLSSSPTRKREQRRVDVLGLPPPDRHNNTDVYPPPPLPEVPPGSNVNTTHCFLPLPGQSCLNAFSKGAAVRCPHLQPSSAKEGNRP